MATDRGKDRTASFGITRTPLNWAYQQACAPVLDVST
jgi:hypothetical protein